MEYFLGLDGGGTETETVIINDRGKVVGRSMAEGSNATIFGQREAVKRISGAIFDALNDQKVTIKRSCLAIAGVDTEKTRVKWQTSINNNRELLAVLSTFRMVNDTLAALRSGTKEGNAVVIIAGTGSSCYGRRKDGREAKSGGVGHILSDDGSAYEIGLSILRNIVRALDGRGPDTILKDLLFEKFQLGSLADLFDLVYEKPWNKVDIAQIAPLSKDAVDRNDKIAIQIIQKAADDLGEMIKAVVTRLDLTQKDYTVVTTGSVFKMQILKGFLEKRVKDFSPKVNLVKPSMSSAEAVAFLALEGKY